MKLLIFSIVAYANFTIFFLNKTFAIELKIEDKNCFEKYHSLSTPSLNTIINDATETNSEIDKEKWWETRLRRLPDVDAGALKTRTVKDFHRSRRLGIDMHPTNNNSILKMYINSNLGSITNFSVDDPFYGIVYLVDRLPKPRKIRRPYMPAFLHPDLEKFKLRLQEMGYQLMFDSSLPFTNVVGYLNTEKKYIALHVNSNWSTFLHEFQHAEFDYYLSGIFSNLVRQVNSNKSISDLIDPKVAQVLGAAKINRIEELIKKGLPELAVNEALSIDEQLRLLGLRRYISTKAIQHQKYAVMHQVQALRKILEETGSLTEVQLKTLVQATLKYQSLNDSELIRAFLKGIGGAISISIAAGAGAVWWYNSEKVPEIPLPEILKRLWNHINSDPDLYLQIIYNEIGQAMAQMPDGTWIWLEAPNRSIRPRNTELLERPK